MTFEIKNLLLQVIFLNKYLTQFKTTQIFIFFGNDSNLQAIKCESNKIHGQLKEI